MFGGGRLGWAGKNTGASDRRSSGPVEVVKYGAGWYQRISRVRRWVRAVSSCRRRSEELLQMAVVGEGVVCCAQSRFVQEARQV